MSASGERKARAARAALRGCRRIVVKIGSRALAQPPAGGEHPEPFAKLAGDIAELTAAPKVGRGARKRSARRARRVVVVSSGAIALGMKQLKMRGRPRSIDGLQAAAAAGQSVLMQRYGEHFGEHGLGVAQVLLTHADLASRERANNARAALAKLLDLGVVPIINENDAVAVDEIRFGDNDELAAMVAPMCDAQLLILLSDVDGVLDRDGQRVSYRATVDGPLRDLVDGRKKSAVGSGGMASKLEAARRATLAGSHVVIAAAHEPNVLRRVLAGDDIGTLISGVKQRLSHRKHWIAFTLRPRGAALLDDGACRAVQGQGRSVLCVGVAGVRGHFAPGDVISLTDPSGRELGRGLTRLSSADAARLAGQAGAGQAGEGARGDLLVHRDDLVILPTD